MDTSSFLAEATVALHALGGTLAVVSGYAALFAPKGGPLHRRAGTLFVYSMVLMGIGAAFVGLARDKTTWLGGPMVIYFVITAVRTVRRDVRPGLLVDGGLLLLALAIGTASFVGLAQALMAGARMSGPIVVMGVVNASLLLLAAGGDARVLMRGPLTGSRRLARHLWRMCYAAFSATGSFFLGQPQAIPELLRNMPTRLVLAFVPLVILFYWMWRVWRGRHPRHLRQPDAAVAATQGA